MFEHNAFASDITEPIGRMSEVQSAARAANDVGQISDPRGCAKVK
jgi:hypothetical protein